MQKVEWSRWLMVAVIVWGAAWLGGPKSRGTTLAQTAGAAAVAQVEAPPAIAWEYKIVRVTEDLLNQAGAEGWEVVAAVGEVKGQSAGMRAINTLERAILKRPKKAEAAVK
jgi:hypothetical protein